MRLHILSDLHLETGPRELGATDADVVVLAGDIDVGHSAAKPQPNYLPRMNTD